jgi:enhancer of mRNA-decapping protein 3
VIFLWSGQKLASYTLEAYTIADLEISPTQEEEITTPTASAQQVPTISTTQAQQEPPTFVDPAIVSYTKPANGHAPSIPPPAQHDQPISPIMIAGGAVDSHSQAWLGKSPLGNGSISSISTAVPTKVLRRKTPSSATLTEPFDALSLDNVTGPQSSAVQQRTQASQTGPGIIDVKDMNTAQKSQKKAGKGKGWRQTPLIEDVPRQPMKTSRRGRKGLSEDVNGWATEDATDIQDLGEFDFESNLSKFNKRKVFDDIRQADTTAEADRLVSFNRMARPGTNGGKNLHHTENVLDVPDVVKWKESEAGETEDDVVAEGHYSSGKGSKRNNSRRPIQSRKGSILPVHIDRTESPRPINRMQTSSPLNGSISGFRAAFKHPNNKPCHCLSPLQMLEMESICTSELGMTEDMMTENASRSIAGAVLKLPKVSAVVLLVGNHKSGARAVAAARHLRNRRLKVTVIVLGGEREEMLLEVMKKQLAIYIKGQGSVARWDEYVARAAQSQPTVVVDALLGVHNTFEELRTDDQATVLEMIRWANRTTQILSIDVPSGLSATTGLPAEVDDQPLVMNSKFVLALGAPKTGLLYAMAHEALSDANWQVWVADIGISAAAWAKQGSRRKHGTEFGTEWVIPLKLEMGK